MIIPRQLKIVSRGSATSRCSCSLLIHQATNWACAWDQVRRINVHFSAVFSPPRSKSSTQGPNPQIVDSQNHVQLGVPLVFRMGFLYPFIGLDAHPSLILVPRKTVGWQSGGPMIGTPWSLEDSIRYPSQYPWQGLKKDQNEEWNCDELWWSGRSEAIIPNFGGFRMDGLEVKWPDLWVF